MNHEVEIKSLILLKFKKRKKICFKNKTLKQSHKWENEFKRILYLVNLTSATTWHQPVEEFIPIVQSVLTVNK